jgi:hypothetical protein
MRAARDGSRAEAAREDDPAKLRLAHPDFGLDGRSIAKVWD